MFVRKKPNKSGSTSVVVIEKRKGKACYLKTIGVSSDENEINEFYAQGKKWIKQQLGLRDMFLEHEQQEQEKQEQEKAIVEELKSKKMQNGTV